KEVGHDSLARPPATDRERHTSRARSRVEIRNQLAFQPSDLILEHELAFFQASQLELVDVQLHLQTIDDVVQVAMLDPQLSQPCEAPKSLSIDLVFRITHECVLYRKPLCQSHPSGSRVVVLSAPVRRCSGLLSRGSGRAVYDRERSLRRLRRHSSSRMISAGFPWDGDGRTGSGCFFGTSGV